MYSCDRTTY
ncbi:hypothetical protein D039_4944A, partial [Vibrio parahaemolyticus EKP-028]